jgi:hypothetical protein
MIKFVHGAAAVTTVTSTCAGSSRRDILSVYGVPLEVDFDRTHAVASTAAITRQTGLMWNYHRNRKLCDLISERRIYAFRDERAFYRHVYGSSNTG